MAEAKGGHDPGARMLVTRPKRDLVRIYLGKVFEQHSILVNEILEQCSISAEPEIQEFATSWGEAHSHISSHLLLADAYASGASAPQTSITEQLAEYEQLLLLICRTWTDQLGPYWDPEGADRESLPTLAMTHLSELHRQVQIARQRLSITTNHDRYLGLPALLSWARTRAVVNPAEATTLPSLRSFIESSCPGAIPISDLTSLAGDLWQITHGLHAEIQQNPRDEDVIFRLIEGWTSRLAVVADQAHSLAANMCRLIEKFCDFVDQQLKAQLDPAATTRAGNQWGDIARGLQSFADWVSMIRALVNWAELARHRQRHPLSQLIDQSLVELRRREIPLSLRLHGRRLSPDGRVVNPVDHISKPRPIASSVDLMPRWQSLRSWLLLTAPPSTENLFGEAQQHVVTAVDRLRSGPQEVGTALWAEEILLSLELVWLQTSAICDATIIAHPVARKHLESFRTTLSSIAGDLVREAKWRGTTITEPEFTAVSLAAQEKAMEDWLSSIPIESLQLEVPLGQLSTAAKSSYVAFRTSVGEVAGRMTSCYSSAATANAAMARTASLDLIRELRSCREFVDLSLQAAGASKRSPQARLQRRNSAGASGLAGLANAMRGVVEIAKWIERNPVLSDDVAPTLTELRKLYQDCQAAAASWKAQPDVGSKRGRVLSRT